MPIEPVKIPQNVYIEDRIVGPLTLKQIIISMLGIGFSYAVWASIAKVQGTVPIPLTVIVWIPGALSVIFSFVKINDLTLSHLVLLMAERVNKPQTRVYGPRRGLTVNTRSFGTPATKGTTAPKEAPGDITKLTAFLDEQGVRASAPADHPEDGTAATVDDVQEAPQGSAVPARPVDKNRVKVSPLLMEDVGDLENAEGASVFRDVFHPPASHA